MLYSLRRCWVEVMADRTDCLLTRDLMLEAVPCIDGVSVLLEHQGRALRIRRTYSSANIFAARETWSLGAGRKSVSRAGTRRVSTGATRTDDEGDHGCAVTTSGLEPLNELLDLPYLDLRPSVSMDAQHNTRTSRAVQRA